MSLTWTFRLPPVQPPPWMKTTHGVGLSSFSGRAMSSARSTSPPLPKTISRSYITPAGTGGPLSWPRSSVGTNRTARHNVKVRVISCLLNCRYQERGISGLEMQPFELIVAARKVDHQHLRVPLLGQ